MRERNSDDRAIISFVLSAINEHKSSNAYLDAAEAQLYYDGENPTINRYEKIIYDMYGKAHVDRWSANHKIASPIFGLAVSQEKSYLLGNGVSFTKDETKNKLGKDFDQRIGDLATYSLVDGVAFGFWNLDRLQAFRLTEFAPLYDEENGALMAGVRFWQLSSDKPLRATLYEMDGYTDYIQRKGEEMSVVNAKRSYKMTFSTSEIDGTEILNGENYPGFPIVPLKADEKCKSRINGKKNTIDALDLATSGMVNNTDEGNLLYWVIQGADGMDDVELSEFIEQIRITHTVKVGNGQSVDPHTIEAPIQSSQTTIDSLTQRLITDFQMFDFISVSAGDIAATAIRARYVPLDLKVDGFEPRVTDFIHGILEIAGIEDDPSYTRNQLINKSDEMQTLLLCAEYMDDEYITKKALTILGDADQYEEVMKRKAAEELSSVMQVEEEKPAEESEEDELDEETINEE